MLGFLKCVFFTGLTFLLALTRVNLLSCISMNNQECKVRPKIVNVNGDDSATTTINAVVVATISIIHSQNCVFLML